jgi:hypothetical protein
VPNSFDIVMTGLPQKPRFKLPEGLCGQISPRESARYTIDMLENLRKMAACQRQAVLAHLLELAMAEARMLVRDSESI